MAEGARVMSDDLLQNIAIVFLACASFFQSFQLWVLRRRLERLEAPHRSRRREVVGDAG